MTSFENKVALIAGAGKGAGRALAIAFAKAGARVAANDISPVNLDDLVEGGEGRIRAYPEDMAKKVGVQAVIKQVEDDWGRIDVLVNHAAVEPHTSILDMDEWDWHRVLDVNLTGAFLTMQSAGRMMRAQGSGVILNLIGNSAFEAAGTSAYAASMHGLIALTLAASAELAPYGVHVHALGRGIGEFHRADASVPRRLIDAALFLCGSSLQGQIVDMEGL